MGWRGTAYPYAPPCTARAFARALSRRASSTSTLEIGERQCVEFSGNDFARCSMPRRTGPSNFYAQFLLIVAAALLAISVARAADPLSYAVTIASTGNRALDSAIKSSSQL